jgi:hypothetical protein
LSTTNGKPPHLETNNYGESLSMDWLGFE